MHVEYNNERSTTVYTGRPTTWEGIVGMMYPSDYGYATDLSLCMAFLNSYSNDACKNNNWLYSTSNQWTLSHSSNDAYYVHYINSQGVNMYVNASFGYGSVRPVVYLKPNIQIVGGKGTNTIPYILAD